MTTFEVKSGEVYLSDPCYTDTLDGHRTFSARNGEWVASYESVDGSGCVYHISALYANFPGTRAVRHTIVDIGVDSGQMGIFDVNRFNDSSVYEDTKFHDKFEHFGSSLFYDVCCNITCNTDPNQEHKSFGTLIGGVVSQSGYGDGNYSAVLGFDESDLLVSVKISFFEEEDECWYCEYPESECVCDRCYDCEQLEGECECDRCYDCEQLEDECECDRCYDCEQLEDECECDES